MRIARRRRRRRPRGDHRWEDLVTLEIDSVHAEVARANLARAGLGEIAKVRVGPAVETSARLAADGAGPVDLVFIDADKPSNPDYFRWALELTGPGGLIVIDNVVRGGTVLEAGSADPGVQGVRRLNELIAAEPRVTATAADRRREGPRRVDDRVRDRAATGVIHRVPHERGRKSVGFSMWTRVSTKW